MTDCLSYAKPRNMIKLFCCIRLVEVVTCWMSGLSEDGSPSEPQ